MENRGFNLRNPSDSGRNLHLIWFEVRDISDHPLRRDITLFCLDGLDENLIRIGLLGSRVHNAWRHLWSGTLTAVSHQSRANQLLVGVGRHRSKLRNAAHGMTHISQQHRLQMKQHVGRMKVQNLGGRSGLWRGRWRNVAGRAQMAGEVQHSWWDCVLLQRFRSTCSIILSPLTSNPK